MNHNITLAVYKTELRVGWDGTKKIVPWDTIFFYCPMGWDNNFSKGVPSHGIASKTFCVPWDGTIFKISHPIPSHGIRY